MDTTADPSGMTLLDPKDVRLQLDQFQDLTLVLRDSRRYAPVRVLPTLPLSSPYAYVAFMDRDGQEIGFLKDARRLDRKSLQVGNGFSIKSRGRLFAHLDASTPASLPSLQ